LIELLNQKDMNEISVVELSAKAGINKTTFYKYYSDVNELLEIIEDDVYESLVSYIEKLDETEHSSDPVLVMSSIFGFAKKQKKILMMMLKARGTITTNGRFDALFESKYHEEWAAMLLGVDEVESTYRISYAISGFSGMLKTWLMNGTKESPEEMTQLSTEILLRGMSTVALPETKEVRKAKAKIAKLDEQKMKMLAEYERKVAEIELSISVEGE
jgi:AcrR family transcriptional regulator